MVRIVDVKTSVAMNKSFLVNVKQAEVQIVDLHKIVVKTNISTMVVAITILIKVLVGVKMVIIQIVTMDTLVIIKKILDGIKIGKVGKNYQFKGEDRNIFSFCYINNSFAYNTLDVI